VVFALLAVFAQGCIGPGLRPCGSPASQRRAALLRCAAGGAAAIPALVAALDDEHPVVRRTAARLLAEQEGSAGSDALVAKGLRNSDVLVRRIAIWAVCGLAPRKALPHLAQAVGDENEVVRQLAVQQLIAVRPRTPQVKELLEKAGKDECPAIRAAAAAALWPFHREVISIRDRKDWDHDVRVSQATPLPKDGWKFKLDPMRDGHKKKWFEPAFDDSKWDDISIEQAWQKAGYDYIGVSWYRRGFDAPAKPKKHVAAELHFGGVDECAWVWLNGVYVGQHDIGPEGWNQPFTLDVTKEIKWGQENRITVRAMNTAHAGGIWRPVRIEVLE